MGFSEGFLRDLEDFQQGFQGVPRGIWGVLGDFRRDLGDSEGFGRHFLRDFGGIYEGFGGFSREILGFSERSGEVPEVILVFLRDLEFSKGYLGDFQQGFGEF